MEHSSDDPLQIRWLAELCELPVVPYYPGLASSLIGHEEFAASTAAHIAWWSKNPDKGSQFEKAVSHLRDTTDAARVTMLRALGYDGLIYLLDRKVVGHVFFQRRNFEFHGFSCWAEEALRGQLFFRVAVLDFLAYASRTPHIHRARAGGGHYPITTLVLTRLRRVAGQLGWRLGTDGWVEFSTPNSDSN